MPEDFFGYETESAKSWLKNPHRDPLRLHEGCKDIAVPNLDIVGWYNHANGDMLLFRQSATRVWYFAQGTEHYEFAATYDGKENPVNGKLPDGKDFPPRLGIAIRKVDANTYDDAMKQDGNEIISGRWIVSKDGKTLTGSSTGKRPNGG